MKAAVQISSLARRYSNIVTAVAQLNIGQTRGQFSSLSNPNSSYVHCDEKRTLVAMTIGQLIDSTFHRFGDRLAVVDRDQGIRKTFSEYVDDINKLAMGFLALNLRKNDRIAIWSPNRYEWILTQFAASKIGLILATINPAYTLAEFEYCMNKLGIRAIVVPESYKTQEYYKIITTLVPQITESKPGQIKSKLFPNFDTLIMLSEKDHNGALKFKDVMNGGGSREKALMNKLQSQIDFDDAINIQFTSGTTGRPKAATLTHFNIINNCIDISDRLGFFNEPHSVCSHVPLFHCFGCVAVSTNAMVSGASIIFPSPGFVPAESLKVIEEEKCTAIFGTPTMFIDMLSHPNFKSTNFESVKTGILAGAPCPAALVKEVMEKMHCSGLVIGYGSTELSPFCNLHHGLTDTMEKKMDNVGKIVPNTELKIVDANDAIVPMGTTGEICARGYQVMRGYWDDEEKTKEVIKDGWYHTGDTGILSEDGHLKVIGRNKDMIIRGGENIYPREIEDLLITHPKINDAHAIGVPDHRLGEEICVWIKIKDNETLNEDEVKAFCKGKLAHFKIPRYIRFVEGFPKTVSGKVQKFVMREEMAKLVKSK